MTVPAAPLHDWRLPRNSKLIRFYTALYSEDVSRLTFCRLFWGIVCSPLVVVLYGVVVSIGWVADRWPHRTSTEKALRAELIAQRKAARKAKGPAWPSRVLTAVASFFDGIAAFVQKHSGVGLFLTYLWRIPAWGIVVGVPTGAFAYGVYNMVAYTNGFMTGLEWVGIVIAGLLACLAVGLALGWLLSKTFIGDVLADAVEWLFGTVIGGFFRWIGRGAVFVGHFFVAGHHAVKYRTCPRGIVED